MFLQCDDHNRNEFTWHFLVSQIKCKIKTTKKNKTRDNNTTEQQQWNKKMKCNGSYLFTKTEIFNDNDKWTNCLKRTVSFTLFTCLLLLLVVRLLLMLLLLLMLVLFLPHFTQWYDGHDCHTATVHTHTQFTQNSIVFDE